MAAPLADKPLSLDSSPSPTVFPMPLHMYPFASPNSLVPNPLPRPKRRQVKNACTNCQKACKKCDDARPCLRCVKYGVGEECVDSQRKERKKGIKRGPYKKRDGKGRACRSLDTVDPTQQPTSLPTSFTPPSTSPSIMGPYVPIALPPGYYGQHSSHPVRSGEPAALYPYYVAHVATPVPPQPSQEGDRATCHAQPPFYPVFHAPFAGQPIYPYPQGFVTVRHYFQVHPNQYAIYGAPIYHYTPPAPGQTKVNPNPPTSVNNDGNPDNRV